MIFSDLELFIRSPDPSPNTNRHGSGAPNGPDPRRRFCVGGVLNVLFAKRTLFDCGLSKIFPIFPSQKPTKDNFSEKIQSDFRSLAYRKQVADVPLQIFTGVYKTQNRKRR